MKIMYLFLISLGAATQASASQPMSPCALAQRLEPLVAEATGIAPALHCPVIGFALPTGSDLVRSQAGAYHPGSGRIDLAPDLDLNSVLGQSYLLHELVHAAQYRAGKDKTVACPAALEAEAYAVQADFLQAHGLMRDAVITRMLAGQLGTCGTGDPGY